MAQDYESPFKPIVSGSDYLSGSEFGQVAGALLSRRDKQDKKQATKALVVSAILETFGQLQRNQKQGVVDSINDLTENYTLETASREAEYNSDLAKENRERLRLYEQNQEQAIQEVAREFYNKDNIISSRNMTYDMRGKISDLNTKKLDDAFFNKKIEDAKEFFFQIQDNPLYSTSNFIDYNKVYHDEYKSALNFIKDDPTKKSLLMAAIGKIFPKKFDATRADLDNALDNADSIISGRVTEQDKKITKINANETMYTKKEAENYVLTNFQQKDNVDDKLITEVLESIQSRPDNLKVSENEIFGMALSKQILNPNNLSVVQKEIREATQLFDAGYQKQFGSIPTKGTDLKAYQDAKTDYLDINVFKIDPVTSQVNRIIRQLENAPEGSRQEQVLITQLNKLTQDEQISSAIRIALTTFIDPLGRKEIEASFSSNENYNTFEQWFSYTIGETKKLLDFYNNPKEED